MTTFYNDANIEISEPNLWEAFIQYLDNNYYPGAAEELPEDLVNFEYEKFEMAHA